MTCRNMYKPRADPLKCSLILRGYRRQYRRGAVVLLKETKRHSLSFVGGANQINPFMPRIKRQLVSCDFHSIICG